MFFSNSPIRRPYAHSTAKNGFTKYNQHAPIPNATWKSRNFQVQDSELENCETWITFSWSAQHLRYRSKSEGIVFFWTCDVSVETDHEKQIHSDLDLRRKCWTDHKKIFKSRNFQVRNLENCEIFSSKRHQYNVRTPCCVTGPFLEIPSRCMLCQKNCTEEKLFL